MLLQTSSCRLTWCFLNGGKICQKRRGKRGGGRFWEFNQLSADRQHPFLAITLPALTGETTKLKLAMTVRPYMWFRSVDITVGRILFPSQAEPARCERLPGHVTRVSVRSLMKAIEGKNYKLAADSVQCLKIWPTFLSLSATEDLLGLAKASVVKLHTGTLPL